MGVEFLAAATEQIDIKEGNASFLPKMDEKKVTDPGLEHKDPSETVSVDGTNGTKGEVKEDDHAANSNLPKDAVDEWPAPKQTHYFYFVRFRTYEDPHLKAKLEQADKELQRKNQSRFQITEALRAKRAERANLSSEMRPLITENKKYKTVIDEKRKEMEPLHAALGQFRAANTVAREKSMGLCSSEEELNDLIQSLHYRIQHESNTLNEEKQLLKELKQLEATREKVISNTAMKVAMKANNQKDTIQDQVKLIGADMDEVRKDRRAIVAQLNPIYEKLKVVEDEINALEEELLSVSERRDKAYEAFTALRKIRDEANTCFYQNRSLLNMAKDLASKKDTKGLEELCNTEVDKFMSRYSSDRTFRDDYEKRILPSLDNRQLSRDGRMRNPDEKPIIVESPPAAKLEAAPLKVIPKQTKEVVNPTLPVDIVSMKKAQGDELIKSSEADKRGKAKASKDNDNVDENDQPVKESSTSKDIDPAKLKEMKREEEMAKAKLATERKKKLAEKQAAKLAARAQKDAERKQKEKEKRAKKKAGTSEPTLPAEEIETDTDAAEIEEDHDVKLETSVPEKHHEQKEKVKYRNKNITKVPSRLPRNVLKKKKSHSYGYYWAVASAVVAVLLAIVVYYYLVAN